MEVKILVRLIKDDIAQLEGITADFNKEPRPSPDEIELALVRANALLRELELLHKLSVQHESTYQAVKPAEKPKVVVHEQDYSEHEPFELFARETVGDEPAKILISEQQDPASAEDVQNTGLDIADQQPDEEPPKFSGNVSPAEEHFTAMVEPYESVVEASESHNIDKVEVAAVEQEVPVINETMRDETVFVSDVPEYKEEILAGEFNEVKKTLNEILGDSHQMVNDILSPVKSESGYKLIPISTIWDGIGINDRFLFIRELFGNSSTKFETSVDELDQLESIQDAVNYLKRNFKWNKTEASQKFLALVKRRFTK